MAATTGGTKGRLEKKNSSLLFMQITPPHGWKEDAHFHYLRLTLPGFVADNITIHMDKYGHLVVRGDRQVSEHKYISFEETYGVPSNVDLEEATGMFEDKDNQIYCVTIPKNQQRQQIIENGNKNSNNPQHREYYQYNDMKTDINIEINKTHSLDKKKFSLCDWIIFRCCHCCLRKQTN